MNLPLSFPLPAVQFMPHDAPMALVDTVLDCQENHITTQIDINSESLFLNKGVVPAWVGIEYMAQSAAAWAGVNALSTKQSDSKPPIGYLLGTRQYLALCSGFNLGDTLIVYAQCLLQSAVGLGSFDCRIERNNEVVATASLSVYQPK